MRELPRYLSEAGGQGVQVVAFLQSLRQAHEIWPAQAPGFLDFFSTVAVFGGLSDAETLAGLSRLTGDYDRAYVSSSMANTEGFNRGLADASSWFSPRTHTDSLGYSSSTSQTTSQSVRKERRLTDADIATLDPGHILVIGPAVQRQRGEREQRSFSIVEAVGTPHGPWQAVLASAPSVVPQALGASIMTRPLPTLEPLEDLVAKLLRDS